MPRGIRLVTPVLAAMVLEASLAVGASGQDEPVRTGIDLVVLDFTAFDRDGNPVTNLQPDQLALRIGGRERPVKSLQFVQLGAARAPSQDETPAARLAPPFGTNYLGEAGRALILIIENDSLRAAVARHTLDAVSEFVADLSPRDRVALVTTPRGGVLMDLTRDHARIRELLSTISGQASQRATDSEKSCRTRDTLTALKGLLEGLTSSDMPKTIVFVSGGILTPRRDAPLSGPPGPCELRAVHYDDVGKAAIEARANFFVIKADDLVIDSAANAFIDPTASRFRSSDEELAGMESLAGVTSGMLLRFSPSDHSAFARVLRETSGYYLLAFEPDASERNGLSHRVDLASTRPDITVRLRPRVVVPKSRTRSTGSQTPQAMLRDGRMYRDLPLRVAAFASANPGDTNLKIVAIAEALDPMAAMTSAAFGLIDPRGRLVAQWTANERELARVPLASAGLAATGEYLLRVAAVDSLGRRGAADYEFEAALTSAGPVRLSALVLGVSRGGFVPRLQFSAEPTVMGFFEMYGALSEPAAASVAFEIAREPGGSAIARTPGVLTVSREPDWRRASGVLPLGALPPGEYVVRAVVSIGGRPAGEVSRTLRKGDTIHR
jgi:VWFA-related protein